MIKKKLCSIILLLSMLFMLAACETGTKSPAELQEVQNSVELHSSSVYEIEEEWEPMQEAETEYAYIANKNSFKLHYSDCASVKRMKESNKVYLDCTRSEAISSGFDPCQKCNP